MPLSDVKTEKFDAKPIESSHSRVDRAVFARRGIKSKHAEKGHCVGYTQDSTSGQVNVIGSVIAQLCAGIGLQEGVSEEHVRYSKIAGRARRNILFVVDTSGSMIASGRLALVKGCVVSLLSDAYVTRTRVAIIGYGGMRARLMLPFTSSAELAAQRIDEAKGGGSTPLLDALSLAMRVIEGAKGEPVEVVLLSDGGFDRSRYVRPDSVIRGFGEFCSKRGVPIFFVDSGNGGRTAQQRAKRLARTLGTDYHCLDDLRADTLVEALGQDG